MTALLDALVRSIDSCAGDRVLVAVDGVDASGKTTLADALAGALAPRCVVRASVDDFLRPAAERRRRGALSPEGCYRDSVDHAALVDRLLVPFARGASSVTTATYDLDAEAPRVSSTRAAPVAVLVVDGVFLLRPELRGHWTVTCHLVVSDAEVLRRAVVRDSAAMGALWEVDERYRTRYLPAQHLYRVEADPERHADVVADNEDPSHPVVRRAWTAAGRGTPPS